MKIVKGQFTPISNKYSEGLRHIVNQLLLKDYKKRPSIQEILQNEAMKKRMQLYGYTENDHLLSATAIGGAGFI